MRETSAIATGVALTLLLAPGCGNDTSRRRPTAAESSTGESAAAAAPTGPRLPAQVAGEYELARASHTRPVSIRQYVRVTDETTAIGSLEASALGHSQAQAIAVEELADRLDSIHVPAAKKARAAAAPRRAEAAREAESDQDDEGFGGTGTKMSLDEGKMGREESTRDRDEDDAGDDDDEGGAFASLTGSADFSTGLDDGNVYGRLSGAEVGEMKGGFGLVAGLGPRPGMIGESAPLLVTDKATRLTRIAEVLASLCHHGARLAVAGDGGGEAVEHQVTLGSFGPRSRCEDVPRAHRDVGDRAKEDASARRVALVDGGFRFADSDVDKLVAPADLIVRLGAVPGAGPTFLVLLIDNEAATVADLVVALDAAAAAGYRSLYLGYPEDQLGVGGGGGWGTIGPGRHEGGGGSGWGTIGTGRHGGGAGSGSADGRGRRGKPPIVRIGDVATMGDLDRNIIRRYIRRSLGKIRHCYEKQLLLEPTLAGKVVVDFTIAPTGDVSSAKASGLHEEVSSCVGRVIEAIKFPKPRGGGLVQVHYPFNFVTSGN